MRLALAQMQPSTGEPADMLARLGAALDQARAAGAVALVVPELVLPGYNRPDLHATAAQTRDGPWLTRLGALARSQGVALVFGWAERDGERVFNAATALGPKGELLAHYRKRQLYGPMERQSFAPGDTPPAVFDLGGMRAGMLVCYDIEFPEHARDLARRGAEVILVPTANPAGFKHVQTLLVPARAAENAVSVAYANYCGTEAGLAFGGRSLIAGPDGGVLATAGDRAVLLIADLPARAAFAPGRLSTQLTDLRQP